MIKAEKTIKVVLVYPPIIFGQKRSFGFPPLGILYIASYLQQKNINVKVIDSFIEGHALEELVKIIMREEPDVVGFSTMTCQVNNVLDITKRIKELNPCLKVVIGGPHISSTKEELFKFSDNIDILFYGEGEKTFFEFINALCNGRSFNSLKGIIYKKDGEVIINDGLPPIQNLDDLPFPELSLLNMRKYDSYYARSLPLTSIMASRGCPFNCTFCDAYATHGKVLRLRSPQNIADELEHNYKKYFVKQFMFKDSTFTVNKKWVYELCSLIINRGLKINWTCNTRVDLVDEEMLKRMKDSGCYMILFGIESGNQRILDVLCKGVSIEQIKKGISICKKIGIETAGYFMIGNPGEKQDDALNTMKLAKELDLDLATFGVTVAYPGTEIYKWAFDNEAILDKFWYINKSTMVANSIREVNGNLNLKEFPVVIQAEMVKKANKGFYLNTSFIIKSILKIKKFQDVRRVIKASKELLQK